jgi:gliding motility-associated-like protein
MTSIDNEVICSGGSPSINFTSDAPATYLWSVASITNVTRAAVPTTGTDLATEILTNISGAQGTIIYNVVATGTTGLSCPGPTQIVTISVDPAPVMTSANAETICSGNTPDINFSSNVVGATYEWIVSAVDPGIGGTFVGKSSALLTPPIVDFSGEILTNFDPGPLTVTYLVTAIGPTPTFCTGIQQTVVVTVDPGPAGVADTEEECSNVALNYDIYADNINNGGNGVLGQFTYVVSEVTTSGITLETPNRTTASTLPITYNYVNLTATPAIVRYTITPVGFGACTAGTPFDVDFVINPEPIITPISETICSGETPAITISSSNFSLGTVDYAYIVSNISGTVSGVVVGDAGTTTTIPHSIDNTSSAQAVVTYTFTPTENINNGCVGQDFDVFITIDPEPVGSDTILPTICSGDPINLEADTFIANLSGNIFSWSVANYNGLTGGASAGLGSIAETLTNTTMLPINVVYDIIPTSSGACPGASFSVTIPIDPEPELEVPAISPAPVCSDVIIGYQLTTLATSVGADSYNIISVTPDVGLTPVVITSGIGLSDMAIFNDMYTNTSSALLNVTYTIVPVTGSCEGEAEDITFGVTPSPIFIADLDNIVCSDGPIGVSLTIDTPTSIVATDYRFESMTAPGLIEDAGNQVKTTDGFPMTVAVASINILAADFFTNNTDNPIDVVYQITPLNGLCEGPTKSITITIEPEVTFLDPGPSETCSGEAVSVVLNSNTNPTNGGVVFDYVMTAPQLTPASSSGISLGQGYTITDVLVNNTDAVQTATYTVFQYAAESAANGLGCNNLSLGTSTDIIVSVDPVPKLDAIDTQTVCSGDLIALELTSPTDLTPTAFVVDFIVSGVDYATGNVTSSAPVGIGDTYAVGDILNDDLTNTTTTTQIVTYQLIPRNSRDLTGCSGDEVTITVNVNPTPQNFSIDPLAAQCAEGIYVVTFNFPVGQAPFRFDYEVRDTGSNTVLITETNKIAGTTGVGVINGIDHVITNDVTVILTRVEYGITAPFCSVSGNLASLDIDIVNPNATFSPDTGFDAVCSTPGMVQFDFVVDTDVTYTWNWGDGSAEEVIDGDVAASPILHQYENPSFADFTYTAFLLVESKSVAGCVKFSDQSVVVYPDVLPIIFAFKEEICSGEELVMFNSSIGAEIHDWTYEVVGFGDQNDQDQSVESAMFTFVNSSDPADPSFAYANPQEFIIHYQGSKDNGAGDVCQTDLADSDTQYSVMVYKDTDVNFDTSDGGRGYSLTIGTVNVGFVNNSLPNPSDITTGFSYDWNYGNGVVTSDYTPETQLYTVARTYDVTHTIANTVAINNGVQCSSSETITISVDEDPILPDFSVDITEGCAPTVFTVTNLTSGAANQFTWKVYDGANIAFETVHVTSQDGSIDPDILEFSFEIFTQGVYTVELRAENVQSGQFAEEVRSDLLNVYESPLARFEMRPSTVVYVPDDELFAFNFTDTGSGTGSEDIFGRPRSLSFAWDFGDGTDAVIGDGDNPDTFHTYELESKDQLDGVWPISLTATFDYGSISCSNIFRDYIRAEFGGTVATPNAFTPNSNGSNGGEVVDGDESNDVFIPKIDGVLSDGFLMQIYDRWGVLVFESTSAEIGWDGYFKGKLLPQGVYVYKLDLKLANGEREVRIGDVTLLK